MNTEEKHKFDYMNNSSYLLRLMLERHNFVIQPIIINNDCIYHILRNGHTVGTLIPRYDEETKRTHNNIRLYKYFKEKFPKACDFIMSKYWIYDGDEVVKFDFDNFDEWAETISNYADELGVRNSDKDHVDTFNDTVNRLTELVDEYDEKFTSNFLIKDISRLLKENERLTNELQKQREKYFELFLKI